MKSLNSILHNEDLFSSLSKEGEKSLDKTIEIYKNSELEEIVKCFNKYQLIVKNLNHDIYNYFRDLELSYKRASKIIKKSYSSNSIRDFSIISDKLNYNNNALSVFYSVLMNKSNEKDFIIFTNTLTYPLDALGYANSDNNITINGDAGRFLGYDMLSGTITLNGNAGESIGLGVKKGTININGDFIYISQSTNALIIHNGLVVFDKGKRIGVK